MKKYKKLLFTMLVILLVDTIGLIVYSTTLVNNGHILLIMFVFELLSTFTFQSRVGLTARNKILLASLVGGLSGTIAGVQSVLLVTEELGLGRWGDFACKAPFLFGATSIGILSTFVWERFKISSAPETSSTH